MNTSPNTSTSTGSRSAMPIAELRRALAQSLAMLEREGIIDFNGHCSARLPDGSGLLVNAGDSVRSRIAPEDFVAVDFDGRGLGDPSVADRAPPMEFHLHAQLYLARPDVHAVIHAHPRWSTVLTTAGHAWQPVTMQAAVLGPVATFDLTASINSAALGRELATFVGSAKAALMRRHGAVTVAGSITDAFVQAIYLEENAQRQHLALQIGTPQPLDADECERIGRNLSRPALLQKAWDYYAAKHLPAGWP